MIEKSREVYNEHAKKFPNIIMLGAPGAGKGSIATKMVQNNDYVQISTGDMFRQEIKNQTPLGLKIKSILDSGAYVDDSITNQLVEKKLTELIREKKHFILDGYPRTLAQAKFLLSLANVGIKIDKVILLEITDEQIIDRLSKRRICLNCKTIYHLQSFPPLPGDLCIKCHEKVTKRPDDEPEVIKKRLSIYNEQTKCLINFYQELGILLKINSYQTIDKVYNDVKEALKWS